MGWCGDDTRYCSDRVKSEDEEGEMLFRIRQKINDGSGHGGPSMVTYLACINLRWYAATRAF